MGRFGYTPQRSFKMSADPRLVRFSGRYVVLSKKSIGVMATAVALVFGLGLGLTAQTPAPAGQEKKKEFKDKAEFDLYDAFTKAATPAEKLAALDKWKQANPDSSYAPDRLELYVSTYQALMQWRQVIDTAQEILKTQPHHVQSLTAILDAVQKLKPPTPADLDLLEKTAAYMADNLDTIYSPANKPPGVEAPAWAQTIATTKPAMKPYLLQTQLSVIKQRNDNVRAIRDLTALLRKDPTQATVSYALAQASLAVAVANKKPEDQPVALYHFARAAAYDGPGSMPAEARKQVLAYLKDKAYSTYHGSAEGLDDLLALAKTNPFPPADFKILSTVDIALAKQKAEAEAAAKDPMMTLWVKGLKDFILKDDTFFDANVKGAALPGGTNGVTKFKGKIVSISPNPKPKEILLAIEKPGVADAKLVLETALPGKMEAGEELQFDGVAKEYQKDPYMVTFDVTKEQIDGWTGKNTPAAVRSKGAAKK
jgi:hypothetical protein